MMRLYIKQHHYYLGIDFYAAAMSDGAPSCVGAQPVYKNISTKSKAFLRLPRQVPSSSQTGDVLAKLEAFGPSFLACLIAVLLRYRAGMKGRALISSSSVLHPKESLLHNKSHPAPGWLLRVVIDRADGYA